MRLSDGVLIALAAAKAEKKLATKEKKRKPASEVVAKTDAIEAPGDTPHKSIAALAKRIRNSKPDSEGVIAPAGVSVHEKSRERAVTILHNLAKACAAKGATLAVREHGLFLVSDAGSVR
ncbi:hypothetical protein AJ87_03120 [Rhizobium yanglingense]|nr:hypothetical protein AJ87_03120 [Rhizobium yanglingense]